MAKSNYSIGPRFIAYHSFHFIRRGSLTLNNRYGLSRGDIFALFPSVTHQYRWASAMEAGEEAESGPVKSTETLEMFWIALDGRQVPSLAEMIGVSQSQPFIRKAITPSVDQVIEEICAVLKDMETSPSRPDLKMLSLIYLLFHEVSLQCSKRDTNWEPDWINRVVEYIRLHYMDGITIRDLVKQTGLNRSHFSRAFTARLGVSPHQYLTNIRMEKALDMLKTDGYSITEIGLSLGFPDLYSFTRSFRNHFGVPPSHYRRVKS